MKKDIDNITHVIEEIPGKKYEKIIIYTRKNSGDYEEIHLKFDKFRNICRIYDRNIKTINYLIQILPADCDIWYCGEDFSELLDYGFSNPFYCKMCPFGERLKSNTLSVHRINDPNFDTNTRERYAGRDLIPEEFQKRRYSPKRKSNNLYMLDFIKSNLKNKKPIKLNLKFDKEDLKYLKKLPKGSNTVDKEGKITQKEVSGVLYLEKTSSNFVVKIDKNKKFNAHDEDTVRLVEGLINFHTHPESVYEKLDTDLMYPSTGDYISLLTLMLQRYYFEENKGYKYPLLFSCVVTLEGIYIISLNKNYCTKDKIKKLRDLICNENEGVYDIKPNVKRSISSKNKLSGFVYGESFDKNTYYDSHCKFIGDPNSHPLGYKQIGGFDYDTFYQNRKIEQLIHFPEIKKQGEYYYDRITQSAKDYCLKINRRELITGTKFSEGPVVNVEFYNYEELQDCEFSVYTYSQESRFLELQPFLDEETIDLASLYSNHL